MAIQFIAVLGLGRIGSLAAHLLHDSGFAVCGIDNREIRQERPYKTIKSDISTEAELEALLKSHDAVLSCLPYSLNRMVAKAAHRTQTHYFDLTEDVPTTRYIRELATDAKIVMAPQCGLAPGFIAIVGAHLAHYFETVRAIRLRVGSLPQNPSGLLGYAFIWSPEGVVNEYLNDCEVIDEGERKWVPSMEALETIYLNGVQLEAFTTSGGLGTMCETYLGRVDNLNYKSMRYPGHGRLMNFFFHELLLRENRELAGKILTHAKPPVDDDVVYVHASVEGSEEGRLMRREFVRAYKPIDIGGRPQRAIAWTTSASVCAVIEMVTNGSLPQRGFIKQEEIPFAEFRKTRTGRLYDDAQKDNITAT